FFAQGNRSGGSRCRPHSRYFFFPFGVTSAINFIAPFVCTVVVREATEADADVASQSAPTPSAVPVLFAVPIPLSPCSAPSSPSPVFPSSPHLVQAGAQAAEGDEERTRVPPPFSPFGPSPSSPVSSPSRPIPVVSPVPVVSPIPA
ncbi:unnamed protein product, partial [Closterium sp. NIES-53]